MSPTRSLGLPVAGALIGFLGSMCGVGGGLFAIPLLHYGLRVELRRAVATALCLVFATTFSATFSELSGESDLRLRVVATLVAGVWIGVLLGYRLAQRLSGSWLRAIFVLALGMASWKILAGGQADPGSASLELGPVDLALTLLVGMGGGMAAPLLGVGGGLIMVPGLLLGVPGVSFEEARASSLAAGAVGSLRSVWLYARARQIDWQPGLALALGAFAGAYLGVRTVTSPEWTELARTVLGGLLGLVALRFLADLVRARRARPEEPV